MDQEAVVHFHDSLLTIDMHMDVPWPRGRLTLEMTPLRDGGVSAACVAAYVPQLSPSPINREVMINRAACMLHAIHGLAEDQGVRVVGSVNALEAAHRNGAIAIMPVVENGAAIGEDLRRLQWLRDLGVHYITLTHNGANDLADAARGRPRYGIPATMHGGLSALGRAAVALMNELGIVVDVSHTSRDAMMQAVELSRAPVIASHSCARSLCDSPRNLDDTQLAALAATGGMVGVVAYPAHLRRGGTAETVGVMDLVDQIDYLVGRVGLGGVGLASDFAGGGGVAGWRGGAEGWRVTAELLRRGYDRKAIAALWGGNLLRVLRDAERVSD